MSAWTTLNNQPSSNNPQFSPGTMLLLLDGRVLWQNNGNKDWYLLTPDTDGNYLNGTWSQTGSMSNTRDYYALQALRDGRVLAVGGERSDAGSDTNLAEIYDPATGAWSKLTNPYGWIQGDVPACLLPDGRVLYGSLSTQQTAIYDPDANAWVEAGKVFGTNTTPTKEDSTSDEEGWILLWDGSVLAVETNNPGRAEKYLPSSDTWVSAVTGTLPVSMIGPGAEIGPGILLPDGRVFQIGGTGNTAIYTPPSDPTQTGTWVAGPAIQDSKGNQLTVLDAPGVLLPNGKVLLVAGVQTTQGTQQWSTPCQLFEYDPVANTMTLLSDGQPSLSGDTWNTRMLVVPSGEVLVTDTAQVWVYTPESGPADAWRPMILNLWDLGQGTFRLDGRQINGLSQACYYGDDVYCATNFPIVSINSQADGKVYYCGSFGNSTMGLTPGTNIHSTQFRVRSDIPAGPATLQVIANGIASAPLPITLPLIAPTPMPTSQGFAVAKNQDWMGVYWIGSDGSVWTVAWNGYYWITPIQIAPQNSAAPGVLTAISRTPDQLDVFWIAPDGSVQTAWWNRSANQAQWNAPFAVAPANSALPSALAAISRTPQNIDIFWIAPDQSVFTNWWAGGVNNNLWNTPFAISPSNSALPGSIAVTSRIPGHLDVFWITSGNAVETNWWDEGSNDGQWNTSFFISANDAALSGNVAAISRGPQNVDVFWVGPDQAVMTNWWFSGANNSQWNTPFAIAAKNSALATGIAAVAKSAGHIDVFWIGNDQAVASNWWDQNANGGNWNSTFELSPANSALAGISALTRTPEQCDVFWLKPLQAIGSNWWNAFVGDGAWNTAFELAGTVTTQPQVQFLPPSHNHHGSALARVPNHLDAFWIASDGSIATAWWDQFANGANWNIAFSIAPANTVQPGSTLVALARAYMQIDVFWVEADGSVHSCWWDQFANGGYWNAQFQLAGPGAAQANAPICAVSRAAQNLDLFWTDSNGAIVSAWWNAFANEAQWNPSFQVAPADSAKARSFLTGVCRQPNHIDVFWIAPNGAVMTVWWDGFSNSAQWNGQFAIAPANSGTSGAALAVACRNANHAQAFWVGLDGTVRTCWWVSFLNGGQWKPAFTIAPAGSADSGAPIAAIARTPNHLDVFWIKEDGSVWTVWWDFFSNQSPWNVPFQIVPAGTANSTGPLSATAREPNHIDVFWTQTDGSVGTTWWDAFSNSGNWNATIRI